MKLTLLFSILFYTNVFSQKMATNIYLIPGQGSDQRIYNNIEFDEKYVIHHIKYMLPEKGTSMKEYAEALASQIDTTEKFIIIGVSLGGMLATEMSHFLNPEKIIIISSAKNRKELPHSYRMQKYFPLYKLFPPKVIKAGAKIMQPIYEPDRNNEKETCVAMLNDKNPFFLKRTIQMIIKWDATESPEEIVHIHGDKDHTIPIRNVEYTHSIEKGSHMMALTRGEDLSELLKSILLVEKK